MQESAILAYAKEKSIIEKSLKNSDFTSGKNYFADIKVPEKIINAESKIDKADGLKKLFILFSMRAGWYA